MNMNKLSCALYNSYSKETSKEGFKDKWTLDNRIIGHCAIVSLIVNDYFGGIIKKCNINNISHYYNEIDNTIYDLTKEQFGNMDLKYENIEIRTRERILSNIDTKKRYEVLLNKVQTFISKLDNIDKNIQDCHLCCELVEKFNNKTSVSYGKNTDVVILGEAPANNGWRKSGKAWYDVNGKILQSGRILNNLLNMIDKKLEDTTFIEAIKCFPKDRKNLKKCNLYCNKYLKEQIKILNPKIIFALGDRATKSILDIKYKKFSDVVGKHFNITIDNSKILTIPIYHPSPISPMGYKGNICVFENLKTF